MAFNTQTRTEFAVSTPEEQMELLGKETWIEMNDARTEWLQAAVDAEKTDKMVSEDGIRNWDSVATAEEFKSFIEGLASNYGLEVTVTIL